MSAAARPASNDLDPIRCTTCGDHGEIDDPNESVASSYEHRLMLGPPATIPCPDCPKPAPAAKPAAVRFPTMREVQRQLATIPGMVIVENPRFFRTRRENH